eukprot:CAMPEP_0117446852 /NCGR_PEP_ID=MMETSP0759-20121206/6563_1 /TAXON_ID=63605 /ORGANISM="Percolomonas cosmopolitus, Strain WS" /LENGTH=596 /DNA_ID=CAMNT_0005239149 /DNA_START=427 /DNA_END=2217 /DNA_ORIENTATION=-
MIHSMISSSMWNQPMNGIVDTKTTTPPEECSSGENDPTLLNRTNLLEGTRMDQQQISASSHTHAAPPPPAHHSHLDEINECSFRVPSSHEHPNGDSISEGSASGEQKRHGRHCDEQQPANVEPSEQMSNSAPPRIESAQKISWIIKDTTKAVIREHRRQEAQRREKEKCEDDTIVHEQESILKEPVRRDSSLMHDDLSSLSAGTDLGSPICASPMDLSCSPMPQKQNSQTRASSVPSQSLVPQTPFQSTVTTYSQHLNQYFQNVFPPESLKSKFSSLFSVFQPNSTSNSPQDNKFLIIDFLFMIRTFCRNELNDLVAKEWDKILEMCLHIEVVDYLALFIVEFGKLFETKWMDARVRELLVHRLMDNMDTSDVHEDTTPEETIDERNTREHLESMYNTGSSMVWMNVLAVEILCLNQQACDLSKSTHRQMKRLTSSTSSSHAPDTLENLLQNHIMSHNNFSTFYETFTQDIVHHSQNDVNEYNVYRFRFLSLIFNNEFLSTSFLYISDLECILRSTLEIVGNLAENQDAQLMFDEASATLIDIIKCETYKKVYNCVLLRDIERLVNYIANNDSEYCCENAVQSAEMIRRFVNQLVE